MPSYDSLMAQPGWYPDPSGSGMQRYFDGGEWTMHHAPLPAAPEPAGVVVTGPNHVMHGILSLLTWPLCGGWIWVWLIVAAQNTKRVRPVDAQGNLIYQPSTAQQAAAAEANRRAWMIGAAVLVGLVVLVFIIAAITAPH